MSILSPASARYKRTSIKWPNSQSGPCFSMEDNSRGVSYECEITDFRHILPLLVGICHVERLKSQKIIEN